MSKVSHLPEVDFLREADKLKFVLRQTYVHDGSRRENSAEHSWHLALAVMATHTLADETLDLARAMKMALLHDVVEIDAGDTFIYDVKGNADKFERELKAADRIFGMLPQTGAELKNLWLEYEKQACPESRFVNALDRFLPVYANCLTEGLAWRKNGVGKSQVLARNAVIEKGSKRLWEFTRAIIEEANAIGHLPD